MNFRGLGNYKSAQRKLLKTQILRIIKVFTEISKEEKT